MTDNCRQETQLNGRRESWPLPPDAWEERLPPGRSHVFIRIEGRVVKAKAFTEKRL